MLDPALLPTTASPSQVPSPEPMPPPPPITCLELLQHVLNHPGIHPNLRLDAWRFLYQHWPKTLDDPVCYYRISDTPAQVPAVMHPR
jgi:hypothetical protein